MRQNILVVAVIFLSACIVVYDGDDNPAPSSNMAQRAVSPLAPPYATADAALRQYYDHAGLELPQAPLGVPLPASNTVLTRIGLGSCQASWKPIPILDQISKEEADLFIYLGDNIYGDERAGDATLPNLRKQYADLAQVPEFTRLRAKTPMMVIWDDHDYGVNDGGGDFAFKSLAKMAFLEFWNEPQNSLRRQREGLYDAKIFGVEGKRVQIIMLDTRFFRSSPLTPTDKRGAKGKERYLPSFDPDNTMLGAEQWRWFEAQLHKPAEIRLIVSSIQVLAADHGWEAWHEFEPQRQKFFEVVQRSGAKGVVVVSGDRHIAAFYKKADVTDTPIYEFTSSALNMSFTQNAEEYDSLQLVKAYGPNNYGMIDIDWEKRELSMNIKGMDGMSKRVLVLKFADIGL